MWISRVVVVPVLLLFPHLRVLLLWRCVTIHRSSYQLCSSAKVVRLSCVCYTAVLGVRRTDNGKWNCNSQSPYSCRPLGCIPIVLSAYGGPVPLSPMSRLPRVGPPGHLS
ncbi:hypothetical protein F5141DRAFT_330422 [Pisolithus sp. B1]|nr:hypothetical protein F5141DRAFT_330422 [Pisolithus sp. B1]